MKTPSTIKRKDFLNRLLAGSAGAIAGEVLFDYRAAWCETPETPRRLELVRTLPTGMARVRGLAFEGEEGLWIAGSEGLERVSLTGEPTERLAPKGLVVDVAVDDEGLILIAQTTRVQRLERSGEIVESWGEAGRDRGQLGRLTGMACSGGMVWLADAGARRVSRFAINGDHVDEIEGFHIPSAYFDLGLDENANLHVGHTSKHRVEIYDRNQEPAGWWGEYGSKPEQFCGCCNPTHLAVFPDGRTVTTEKGIPRLKVHSRDGELLAYLSPTQLGLSPDPALMRGLTRSPDGSLPCHDSWPGIPLAVSPDERIAAAIPGSGEISLFRLVTS